MRDTYPCHACKQPVHLGVDGRWYPVPPSHAVAVHNDCPTPAKWGDMQGGDDAAE